MRALFQNTRWKIILASWISGMLRLFLRKERQIIYRKGIAYEVDLREGIDLALFLTGSFQSHVWQNPWLKLSDRSVILDVGANVGSVCLPMAKQFPDSTIYAFEPTDEACGRFFRNLELNPNLLPRIHFEQLFISDTVNSGKDMQIYSSWRLDSIQANRHPVHRGLLQKATSVPTVTIDHFCEEHEIHHVHFIKIDTDGHEYAVLKGAINTIRQFRPVIVFEIGQYLMHERQLTFSDYENLIEDLNYDMYDCARCISINRDNFKQYIPEAGTIDICAVPA